jgi:hypothetical protein
MEILSAQINLYNIYYPFHYVLLNAPGDCSSEIYIYIIRAVFVVNGLKMCAIIISNNEDECRINKSLCNLILGHRWRRKRAYLMWVGWVDLLDPLAQENHCPKLPEEQVYHDSIMRNARIYNILRRHKHFIQIY